MTLARASGSLARPWRLVQNVLDETLGGARQSGDTYRWTAEFRLYTLAVTADRATGDVEVSVSTTFPYVALAVVSLLVSVAVAVFDASGTMMAVSLVTCLTVGGVALLPGLYHFQWLNDRILDLLNIESTKITPHVVFPIAGFLLNMWTIGTSPVYRGLTLLMAGFLFAIMAYAVGAVPENLRRQQPVLAFAFFSGLPLLVTAGNFGLVSTTINLLGTGQLPLLVWSLGVHTILILLVYAFLCRVFVNGIESIPNEPISSRATRVIWFGYFVLINLMTLLVFVGLLTDYRWFGYLAVPMEELTTAHDTYGLPFPGVLSILAVVLLASPVVWLSAMWSVHIQRQLRQFGSIKRATTPDSAVESTAPVRVLDTDRAVAHVSQVIPGRPAIVISSALKKELDDDELTAVIAHEEYHVRNRDTLWNLFASTFGIAVGGRNVLIASHDYPQVERAADRYAANRCGVDAIIGALRTVERLDNTTAPYADFTGGSRQSRVSRMFAGPYEVLFGSVLIANAHATVEERIESVVTSADGG